MKWVGVSGAGISGARCACSGRCSGRSGAAVGSYGQRRRASLRPYMSG